MESFAFDVCEPMSRRYGPDRRPWQGRLRPEKSRRRRRLVTVAAAVAVIIVVIAVEVDVAVAAGLRAPHGHHRLVLDLGRQRPGPPLPLRLHGLDRLDAVLRRRGLRAQRLLGAVGGEGAAQL